MAATMVGRNASRAAGVGSYCPGARGVSPSLEMEDSVFREADEGDGKRDNRESNTNDPIPGRASIARGVYPREVSASCTAYECRSSRGDKKNEWTHQHIPRSVA